MSMDIIEVYQFDKCYDWIKHNGFRRVVVQLKKEDLEHSLAISDYLKSRSKNSITGRPTLDVYVTRSNTCCVDLLVPQHVTDIDALIHVGQVCLTRPEVQNKFSELPVLFLFKTKNPRDEILNRQVDATIAKLVDISNSDPGCKICILFDTRHVQVAEILRNQLELRDICNVEVARLFSPAENWATTPDYYSLFLHSCPDDMIRSGQYLTKNSIKEYGHVVHLGSKLSIQQTLECPTSLFQITYDDFFEFQKISVHKALNRRMALVTRLKDEEELKIGVIITNPLPDLGRLMDRLEGYCKLRNHMLYYISMIQTIDECKIGNFDLCDAFIVVNSCTCSTILESLVFNRPIITEQEFKLACGVEAEYGGILWPGSSSHPDAADLINRRKVSDVSLALMQTRNELLERCSQARVNKWSGLEHKAPLDAQGGDNSGQESVVIEEGLEGIASSYASEPPTT